MPALPMPMISTLILAFLLIQSVFRGERPSFLSALLAACALQGLVISLAQYYEIAFFWKVQAITAAPIPPLAWITFQVTSIRNFDRARDLQHLIAPIFIIFCVIFAPHLIDLFVPLTFFGYGVAILLTLRALNNNLPLTRLETGGQPVLIWRVMAIALMLSAFSDVLIILAQILQAGWLQPWIIGVFSSLSLLLIGALSISQSLISETSEQNDNEPIAATEGEVDIIGMLSELMQEHSLFLDPSLTLNHLSRRMGIPAKQLSTAINRATGENVSRYINGFRIRYACGLLKGGENVTTTMLESGFNTKSNFNREFLRVENKSPSAWLAEQQGDA